MSIRSVIEVGPLSTLQFHWKTTVTKWALSNRTPCPQIKHPDCAPRPLMPCCMHVVCMHVLEWAMFWDPTLPRWPVPRTCVHPSPIHDDPKLFPRPARAIVTPTFGKQQSEMYQNSTHRLFKMVTISNGIIWTVYLSIKTKQRANRVKMLVPIFLSKMTALVMTLTTATNSTCFLDRKYSLRTGRPSIKYYFYATFLVKSNNNSTVWF